MVQGHPVCTCTRPSSLPPRPHRYRTLSQSSSSECDAKTEATSCPCGKSKRWPRPRSLFRKYNHDIAFTGGVDRCAQHDVGCHCRGVFEVATGVTSSCGSRLSHWLNARLTRTDQLAKGVGSYWSSWFEHVRESAEFVRYLGFDPENGNKAYVVCRCRQCWVKDNFADDCELALAWNVCRRPMLGCGDRGPHSQNRSISGVARGHERKSTVDTNGHARQNTWWIHIFWFFL